MAFLKKRGKVWYLYWTENGKKRAKAISTWKELALKAKRKKEHELDTKRHLGYIDDINFNDFANEYLKFSQATKKVGSSIRDSYSVQHLVSFFGNYLLSEIHVRDIELYRQERLVRVKGATVNRELACLKHMFSTAINWEYIRENPVRKIKMMKEQGKVRYLTEEEIKILLQKTRESPVAYYMLPILMIALNTGMRKGEILSLTFDDIDLKNRIIQITEKPGHITTKPINSVLYKILLEYRKINKNIQERLFPFKNVRKAFNNIVRCTGLKNVTFHTLRHTFGSQLNLHGKSLRDVQVLMGHKNITTTVKYLHLSESSIMESTEIMADLTRKFEAEGDNKVTREN